MSIQFTLNGELQSIQLDDAAGRTLNEYIRTSTRFTGTKVSCAQGGCGACTVALARPAERLRSVASCIMPLASVHGAAILTAEGLNTEDGKPHPIAQRVAKFNASQCGFCTPGMVMQMYATLSNLDGGEAASEKDLEQCINGNICRCTGYRPLVECAKSFAAKTKVGNQIDPSSPIGPYDAEAADPELVFPPTVPLAGAKWLRPSSLKDLLDAVSRTGVSPIAGGTAAGIYPELGMAQSFAAGQVWADITGVKELSEVVVEGEVMLVGATVTWTRFVESLRDLMAKGARNAAALSALEERCGSIAGAQVRNRATIGGNIAIARNQGFLSDWVPPLAALGAKVEFYLPGATSPTQQDLLPFVQEHSVFKGLITTVHLPLPAADVVFRAFRVAKRSRNAHALANAGFAASISGGKVGHVALVVGAVDPKPVRLQNTERALSGVRGEDLQANSSSIVAGICEKVKVDLIPLACHFGREQTEHVIAGFIVKFLVTAFGTFVPKDWQSAATCLHDAPRSTSASQTFPKPAELGGPLNKPIPKTTALEQATGAAKYTDDVPKPEGMLVGAYVLVPEANVSVSAVDPQPAKAMLGSDFHAVLTAEDLAVTTLDFNAFTMRVPPDYKKGRESHAYLLLPRGTPSQFAGQPVALLLARGNKLRTIERAAVAISQTLKYERKGKVAIGSLQGGEEVCEALRTKKGKVPVAEVLAQAKARGGENYMTGKFVKSSQFHFYMEPQSALVIPDEGGLTCYCACQGPDLLQRSISKATGLVQSKVTVKMRRVGGGFGGKFSTAAEIAIVAAQAALKLQLPVRIVLPRETDMALTGGRQELESTWQVAVDPATGKIKALEYDIWFAHGSGEDNQKLNAHLIAACIDEVYSIPSMAANIYFIHQHLVHRTSVRAPGHFEASLLMEAVIDSVAARLKLPAHVVRERNFYRGTGNKSGLAGGIIPQGHLEGYSNLAMWALMKERTNYDERLERVQAFNRANAFKKRGLALVPARYGMFLTPGNAARVDVFKDGSVQIAVTGSELGQGLHTKVGQMVSTMFTRELGSGPPMECIRFLDTATDQNPNGTTTGGSTTSEACMYAAGDAVRQLAERLKGPAKAARKLPADKRSKVGPWFDIIEVAFSKKALGILSVPQNLSAMGMHFPPLVDFIYETYGVAACEVELDTLSGEWKIPFTHLMFDVGMSHNPMVDIGQMEGGFIMGMGQCMNEGVDFDPTTGKLLSDNTWTYKPPIACDVPETFAVELVDMRKSRLDSTVTKVGTSVAGSLLRCLRVPWKETVTEPIYKSSKAIGEPPVLLASAVQSALAAALVAATGGPLPEGKVPMPAKAFCLLPLLKAQKPGGAAARND